MWLFKSKFLSTPWRKINWGDNQNDLNYVQNYKPVTEGQQLRILLHGAEGAGKSSLINSVQTVLHRRMYTQALADNTSHGTFTKEYTTYKVQTRNQSCYPFVFSDLMGLSSNSGILEEDIKLALKGHVKEGYTFNLGSQLSKDHEFYNKSPTPNDTVHVLVCVIPADSLNLMSETVVKKINNIREEASKLKIPQMAILTKIDKLSYDIENDIKNVYRVPDVKTKMETFSANVGIPMNCIFPVKNYHEEINIDDDMDSLILSAMKHIINTGDDFINFSRNRFASS